jgi:hypothetical protein
MTRMVTIIPSDSDGNDYTQMTPPLELSSDISSTPDAVTVPPRWVARALFVRVNTPSQSN